MKTYTLTWKHAPFYGSTLSRCRFEPSAIAWPFIVRAGGVRVTESPILAFMYICCRVDYPRSYRLSSCGRLIARSATYQGV